MLSYKQLKFRFNCLLTVLHRPDYVIVDTNGMVVVFVSLFSFFFFIISCVLNIISNAVRDIDSRLSSWFTQRINWWPDGRINRQTLYFIKCKIKKLHGNECELKTWESICLIFRWSIVILHMWSQHNFSRCKRNKKKTIESKPIFVSSIII